MGSKRQHKSADHEILGPPAAYSHTTAAEMTAVGKLKDLLDKTFVKPDLKELDKFPNTDGYLEITDAQHIPIGKLEAQVKTIKTGSKPKYQCEKEFLAYCLQAILPVLLIGVDIKQGVAFWKHCDRQTLLQIAKKIKKGQKTATIGFPAENTISYGDSSYVEAWIKILEEYKEYALYPELKQKATELEEQLQSLRKLITPAVRFSSRDIAEMNRFLDLLNHILTHEFKYTKSQVLYNYSKIGLAVAKYTSTEIRFLMYPVKDMQNEPLIKELEEEAFDYIDSDTFQRHNALEFAFSKNFIRENPEQYAYHRVKSWVLRSIKHFSAPIGHAQLAREYLSGFLTTFYQSLGYEQDQQEYNLADVAHKIKDILPLMTYKRHSTSLYLDPRALNIDFLLQDAPNMSLKRRAGAERIFQEQGPLPSPIRLSSSEFSLPLVYYYLDIVLESGTSVLTRYYHPHAYTGYNPHDWKNWQKAVLIQNLAGFFEHFLSVYEQAINENFHVPGDVLQFMGTYETCICLLVFKRGGKQEPFLQFYFMEGPCLSEKRIYFFDADATNCPIDRDATRSGRQGALQFNSHKYSLRRTWIVGLDFMFADSPMYALIQKLLENKLKPFFDSKRPF